MNSSVLNHLKVVIVFKSRLLQIIVLFFTPLFLFAGDIAEEPQVLDPVIDQKLIRSLKLDNSAKDWNDNIINILLVGQDGQQVLPYPYITRENGTQVKRLSSRADASIVLSFNRMTGKTSLFSIERNNADPTDHNEIITHQYIINGRKKYVQRVKERVEQAVHQLGIESQVLAINNQLHIHGMLELDFQAFKKMISNLRENMMSSAQLAWAFKGHSIELMSLLKDDNQILRNLRARQNFQSASYQRSLNHALFLSSAIGLVSYTQVDAGAKNLFELPVVAHSFAELSRTFSLTQLLNSLRLVGAEGHMLERSGFQNGLSTTDVYLLGVDTESYASYTSGQLKVNVPLRAKNTTDQLMYKLDVTAGQFLKVKDCSGCR